MIDGRARSFFGSIRLRSGQMIMWFHFSSSSFCNVTGISDDRRGGCGGQVTDLAYSSIV